VIILDENIPAPQRQLLEHWKIRVRQIGFNVGRRGMQDDEIIPLLSRQRRPTFITRDADFYDRELCHSRYCLVYAAVEKNEVAFFVRRTLRQSALSTVAKRLGSVVRISRAGLAIWRAGAPQQSFVRWERGR
jgi:predicted nuclease of predicted toxin-antitoxin system